MANPICPNCRGYAKGNYPELVPSGLPEPFCYVCPCDCRATEGDHKNEKRFFDSEGVCHYWDETKICNKCGTPKPTYEFREVSSGSKYRRGECNECHAFDHRVRRARIKSDKIYEIANTTDVHPAMVKAIIEMWNNQR